jgi:DNA-binding beta-propeller fold protein YncE
MTLRSSAWVGLLTLGLLACGDDLDPIETDDDGVVDPCDEQASGTACTWLGTPGQDGFTPDGAHRLDMKVYWTMDALFASDGTVWFDDWNNHVVRRVMRDGTVKSMVGWVDPIFPGDGVPGNQDLEHTEGGAPGTDVRLNHPTDLVELPSGEVLLMAWHNHKLRIVDPDSGNVRIVCGKGAGFAGDGGPATNALFKQPSALAMDEAGNLYIGDQQNFRVRKIDTDGNLSTIVGNGMQAYGGDGGPALEASLNWEAGSNPEPSGSVAVADGKLYISDTLSHRIRVVDLETNVIQTLAGTGAEGLSGDGGPAVAAELNQPRGLELGPDGDLYFADTNNHVIRAIDLESGEIRRVVGTGELGISDEGRPAVESKLRRPFGLEFDPDGNLYVMDSLNSRILKVAK